MAKHSCEAIVITCIDFRFQEFINQWLRENFQPGSYDRGAFAGVAKELEEVMEQVEISSKLHHIKKVVLINHEDCGAYGKSATLDNHVRDLRNARKTIKKQFPNLEIETSYLRLNGEMETV